MLLAPAAVLAAVSAVLSIPVAMATFYAPALIALRRMSTGAALRSSFRGAAKNVAPLVRLALRAILVASAVPFTLVLTESIGETSFVAQALTVMGITLFLVEFLVGLPLLGCALVASAYVSYRDVFFLGPDEDESDL